MCKLLNSIKITAFNDQSVLAFILLYDATTKQGALELCKSAVSEEIKHSTTPGTLFRRNSFNSKLLTLYCRIHGQQYLHSTIKGIVNMICEENQCFEIDKGRLKSNGDVTKNGLMISRFIQAILQSIRKSSPSMNLRLLFNYTMIESEKAFPNCGEMSVGGLFFLRFVNPALIAPHTVDLINDPPRANSQRTLTLITKALQNIANGVEIVENKKEAYMTCLTDVIKNNIGPTKEFLKEIAVSN